MSTVQHHGDYADLQPSLGWRLRIARERRTGLDQDAFAELIHVSRGTVSNYERDHTPRGRMRQLVLSAWALATGVTVEWLETGTAPTGDPGEGHRYAIRDSNPEPAGYEQSPGRRPENQAVHTALRAVA